MRINSLGTLALCFSMLVIQWGCDSSGTASNSTVTITGTTANLSTSQSVIDGESFAATSGIDPSSVQLKIYKIAVSSNEDCSDLIEIYEVDETDAEYVEFNSDDPLTLGSGSLADGTYPCVAFEMSDFIRFTPAETSDNGFCDENEQETLDVCQDRGESSDDTSTLFDGTTTTCAEGENEERVALYLSTLSTALPKEQGEEPDQEGNPFKPATEDNTEDGFLLDGAFTVEGDVTASFVVDFTGRVAESEFENDVCEMESPNWGFEAADT